MIVYFEINWCLIKKYVTRPCELYLIKITLVLNANLGSCNGHLCHCLVTYISSSCFAVGIPLTKCLGYFFTISSDQSKLTLDHLPVKQKMETLECVWFYDMNIRNENHNAFGLKKFTSKLH